MWPTSGLRALTFKLAGGQVGNYQRNGNKLRLFTSVPTQISTFKCSSRIIWRFLLEIYFIELYFKVHTVSHELDVCVVKLELLEIRGLFRNIYSFCCSAFIIIK